MTTTLRYIGDTVQAFSDPRIGMREFGDTFGVPNNQAEPYARRADIEVVDVEPDETDEMEQDDASESDAQPAPEPDGPTEPDAE